MLNGPVARELWNEFSESKEAFNLTDESSVVFMSLSTMKLPGGLAKKPRGIVSISSGKGGVGKTLTTVNLAVAARRMGLSVLILDGDFGLANVDVVLGLQARYNINDVLEGTARLSDIVLNGPLGIKIIPSGSGLTKMAQLSYVQRLRILDQIDTLEESFNLILIDTGAGLS